METLVHWSQIYGSGNVSQDIALASLAIALLCLGAALLVSFRGRGRGDEDAELRMGGLAGRLEKIEMTLNSLRTETLRSVEHFRGEVGFLKQELGELRALLSRSESSSTPPALGQGGSGSGSISATPPELGAIRPLPSFEKSLGQSQSGASASAAPLGQRLKKTRQGLFSSIKGFFSRKPKIDQAELEEVEALLVGSDLGVKLVSGLIEEVKRDLSVGRQVDQVNLVAMLKARILSILQADVAVDPVLRAGRRPDGPLVVMLVGVNGAGKTTTAAKLASLWQSQGSKVLLVAADTFRAAAVDQLTEWATRIAVPVVSGAPQAKPAAVVFEAMERAQRENFDIVLIDTAGRLHTKTSLMQELEGVCNSIRRHQPSAPHETLLVVDGSSGQNALVQAREFNAAASLSGLVVTKLDGTPKGGIVVAIKDELGIPVRFIGVGESVQDLRPFEANEFVEAIFEETDPESEPVEAVSANGEKRRRRREDGQLGAVGS